MQLSARILTALAVLAFTVAVVAGRGATEEVSAATGTIDAMNVGACTTTNGDALKIGDCKIGNDGLGNTTAFFEAGTLDEAIEVDELYATYAHDPKTAAEAPRGIIANADLIKISIKDTGRDRRDPVLIAVSNSANDGPNTALASAEFQDDGTTAASPAPPIFDGEDTDGTDDRFTLADDYVSGDPDTITGDGGSLEVVADSVGVKPEELAGLALETSYFGIGATTADANFDASGSYTIVWRGTGGFQPIAPDGKVKFFGCVDETIGTADSCETGSGFEDIGGNVKLDEDVVSGENGTPAMVLNVSVPTGGEVLLQVVYYETSDEENLVGGTVYCDEFDADDPDTCAMMNNGTMDVVFTSAEKKNNTALLVQAASDGNDANANLHLKETGLFDGVYEGFLRLTDADGNGGGGVDGNWGENIANDGNAMDDTVDGAAVLGVGNGPVVISYRDSDGQTRTFTIQIDIDPPVINIDSPVHKSRSDDEKPSFVGTISDGDAGLAADTFQLDVDNDPDDTDIVMKDLSATVMDGDDGIDRRLEYKGYNITDGATSKYGVIDPGTWRAADLSTGRGEKTHRSVEADAYANGAPDGEFADEIEIDFDEAIDEFVAFNDAIEFQALVRDLAGNVGFSDSDPAKPRFINNLGEKADDRGTPPRVLGVFSNHIVWLDKVDPFILNDRTATGFYGLDDGAPIRDRSSVMVVFDNPVEGSLIDSGTFTLEDADGNGIAIADVMVKDQLVFLKLDEELASDATPTLSLTEGREVEDLAGNILSSTEHILEANSERVSSFKVNDGILPVFTLTLSGGSGTGAGGEGPDKLTKETIDIAIESDEDINGAPKVSVVCSNIKFNEADGSSLAKDDKDNVIVYDLGRFEANRMGYDADTDLERNGGCGSAASDADSAMTFIESSSLSRPGNNWVYAWRNRELPDGGLTVVVWGRDRGGFDYYKTGDASPCDAADNSCDNYGSETAAFTLDTTFNSPLSTDGGDVQPDPNSDVAEPRPFVLLDFAGERTNVNVTKLMVDGADVLGSLDNIGENRFLYWPEALDYGEHTVEFDARDAADNKPVGGTKFTFKVTQRDPFVLDISAGWNAISFPANPVDTALDAVFTDPAIDRVVGWNPMNSNGAWSIASRVDGVWTTSMDFAPLTDVVIRYGYWVHSMAFIKQSVDLEGPINRETGGKPNPIGIQTVPGWNFIGVVDQDGDQTEGHWNEVLQDSEDADVSAKDYMPGFKRAYTWDAIANGYRVLEGDDPMRIGKGIWVFFPDGTTVAP